MSSKCTYPSCEGIFPEANLERCSTTGCEQLLHHVCQGRYEHNMGVELDLHKFCYLCAKREVLTVLRGRNGDNDTRNDTGNGSVIPLPDMPPIDSLKSLRGGDENTITETSQQETTSPLPPPFPPQVEQQQIQGVLSPISHAEPVSKQPARYIADKSPRTSTVHTSPSSYESSPTTARPATPPQITQIPTRQSPRGKELPPVIIPLDDKSIVPKLKPQTGLVRNSVVVCPGIYLYHDKTKMAETLKDFKEMYGPYAYGKIVSVPNKKANVLEYAIEYDPKKSATVDDLIYDDLCTSVFGNMSTRKLLKRGVE